MGAKNASGIPVKLNTWRLTSHSKPLLDHVAGLYGGEVTEWKDAPNEGENWQVTTEATSLRVLVPPGEMLSQFFEQWSGGGCKKRCDGQTQVFAAIPCSCPADLAERMEKAKNGDACTPATRLSVMLLGVPDLGVWRLETHGYTAAQEIAGTYDVLKMATDRGTPIPARLTITHRTSKTILPNGKARTSRYTVPVLEIDADVVGAVMDQLPQLPIDRNTLGRPIEGKVLPGGEPPAIVSTGELVENDDPDIPPQAVEPRGLPSWLMELPGEDGDIVDMANMIATERGLTVGESAVPLEFTALSEFQNAPEWFQEELRNRLAGLEPDPDDTPDPGDTWGQQ